MAPSTRKRNRSVTKADDGDAENRGDGAMKKTSTSIAPPVLHRAVAAGDKALMVELIGFGADINVMWDFDIDFRWKKHTTPLAVAIANNHVDIAQLLIEAAADLYLPLRPGVSQRWPLLHLAIFKTGSAAMVDLVLRTDAFDVNETFDQDTPLMAAIIHFAADIERGQPADDSVLRRLLAEPGIDVNSDGGALYTGSPLHRAVCYDLPSVVEMLLAAHADPNIVAEDVMFEDDYSIIDGYNTNSLEDASPLHLAAFFNAHKMVEALVAAGADVNARSKVGYTPLILSAMCIPFRENMNPKETMTALVKGGGAEVNALCQSHRNWPNKTALHYALGGSPEISEHLIQLGGDIHAIDANFILRKAVDEYDADNTAKTISILMDAGLDWLPTAQHPNSKLLHLHLAEMGYEAAVQALLKAGADAKAKNKQGKTVLQLLEEEVKQGRWRRRCGRENSIRHDGTSAVAICNFYQSPHIHRLYLT